ncbi:MAG: YceI family protein [Acidobacteria bacterium]|nr:YceI family protein [Acidobacteriota bacterium]
MYKKILSSLMLFTAVALAADNQQWVLEQSTLAYRVSHPLHQTDGVSHAARGKGICHENECNFLIAAPVKSFASGDSNRDLHMIQATRGAQFPLVTVRTRIPESSLNSPALLLDLEVEFAGQTVDYSQVRFQQVIEGAHHRISGTVPAKVSDFKIERPTLLTVPIKDEMPVRVEMVWKPAP